MTLPRFFSQPNTLASSTSLNGTVTDTPPANGPGYSLAADLVQTPTLITAPPASASVTVTYTASVATVVQNTLGYDAQFVGYLQGAASVATFQVGTGPTSTVTMTPVATGVTATAGVWSFPAYVPNGYYYSTQFGASVNSTFTVVAHPV